MAQTPGRVLEKSIKASRLKELIGKGGQFRAAGGGFAPRIKGEHKYLARKKTVHGITFHSTKEADRYLALLLSSEERNPTIRIPGKNGGKKKDGRGKGGWRQVPYVIRINGKKICTWYSDFEYQELVNGEWIDIVEDCKGFRDYVFKLKKKMVEAAYNIKIKET